MILPEFRAALTTQIGAGTDCPFKAVNPAEDKPLRECIWVRRLASRFEWRSLGATAPQHTRNRTETLTVELQVHVYREGVSQATVAETVFARCEAILAEIEAAVDTDQSFGDVVSFGRVAEVTTELSPRDGGWTAVGTCRIEAQNYPA